MKINDFKTESKAVKQRLDPKCWTGKHKEGTKIKGGVRVNNCVPNESVKEAVAPTSATNALAAAAPGTNAVKPPPTYATPPAPVATAGSGEWQYFRDDHNWEAAIAANGYTQIPTKAGTIVVNNKKQPVGMGFMNGCLLAPNPQEWAAFVKQPGSMYEKMDDAWADEAIRIGGKMAAVYPSVIAQVASAPFKMVAGAAKAVGNAVGIREQGVVGNTPKDNELRKNAQDTAARAKEEIKNKMFNTLPKPGPQDKVHEEYNGEYDDEAGMADNNLETLKRTVEGIDELIQSGDNLPEWCQEKIAVAKSMLVNVWDYMYSEEASDEVDPEVDEMFEAMDRLAEEMARKHRVSVDRVWEQFEDMDDTVLYETAAWRRKEGKSKTGGLNAKGVASYRRENPGSKLQTAVTTKPSKLKPGSKAAKRRKSFCARMSGVKGPMKKPNGKPTRKALALRKWNC